MRPSRRSPRAVPYSQISGIESEAGSGSESQHACASSSFCVSGSTAHAGQDNGSAPGRPSLACWPPFKTHLEEDGWMHVLWRRRREQSVTLTPCHPSILHPKQAGLPGAPAAERFLWPDRANPHRQGRSDIPIHTPRANPERPGNGAARKASDACRTVDIKNRAIGNQGRGLGSHHSVLVCPARLSRGLLSVKQQQGLCCAVLLCRLSYSDGGSDACGLCS